MAHMEEKRRTRERKLETEGLVIKRRKKLREGRERHTYTEERKKGEGNVENKGTRRKTEN